MKYFTREWARGKMSDGDAEAVPDACWRYVATLYLPPSVEALSQINPHDAKVLEVEYQQHHKRLSLELRCGDLQRGYLDVTLTFLEVRVDEITIDVLNRSVRPARVEVLYDEVDRTEEGYEYRLLLYPENEVCIGFRDVEITIRPVPKRED